jgi:hypothetical protein
VKSEGLGRMREVYWIDALRKEGMRLAIGLHTGWAGYRRKAEVGHLFNGEINWGRSVLSRCADKI